MFAQKRVALTILFVFAICAPHMIGAAEAVPVETLPIVDPFGLSAMARLGLPDFDIRVKIIDLVNVALSFLGLLSVIVFMWGGLQMMLSGGKAERITAARKTIVSGIIGTVLILSSYAIVYFVISNMLQVTGAPTATNVINS